MKSGGFVSDMHDASNHFHKIAFKQIKFNKKILGTKVLVTRTKQDSKYKKVYGALYNSGLKGNNNQESFEYVVLINMNDMHRLYQRTIDQLEFYDNEKVLDMGDTLTYYRSGRKYQFKITAVDTWSDDIDVLYKYTIAGMNEINTESDGNCQNSEGK